MKSIRILAAILLAVALCTVLTLAQSGYDLFQKGLVKERAEGDMQAAIQIFTRIVKEFPTNRELAAKALVEMGNCYEKLGKSEAQKTYQRVLRDYADQSAEANEARARLAALEHGGAQGNEMVVRRVWSGTDWDNIGPVSPDGRSFSCADWETGGDLAVCDLATGKKRRLTSKPPQSPEAAHTSLFSPDGKQIAYSWDKGYASSELKVVGLDGTKPHVIYSSSELRRLWPNAWSPDGRYILTSFNRKQDHVNQLVWVAVGDGSVRSVKNFGTKYPLAALVSPDGHFIAYDFPQQDNPQNRDIFLVSSDGRQDIPLVQQPANDYLLGWTPSGSGVLFASDRTGSWDAWIEKVDHGRPVGAPELVKKDIGRVRPLGFARNGAFYYSLDAGKSDLYLAPLDLTADKVLGPPSSVSARFVGSNDDLAWSPDGKYLAYFSIRGDANSGAANISLRVRSLQTGKDREFFPKLHNLYGPRWFPDDKAIAVGGFDTADNIGLYRIDAQTGEVSPIVRGEDGIQPDLAGLSPDGERIFYSRYDDATDSSTVLSRDLATGAQRELYRSPHAGLSVWNLTLSPNGQELAFTLVKARDFSTLCVMPASGGEPRELLTLKKPELISFGTVAWTPDGRDLIFGKSRPFDVPPDFKTELWKIPASGGQPQKIELAADSVWDVHIRPDGKRIAYNSGTWGQEIWVMENFLPALKASR